MWWPPAHWSPPSGETLSTVALSRVLPTFKDASCFRLFKISRGNLLGEEVRVGRLELVSSLKSWHVSVLPLIVGVDLGFLIWREANRVDAVGIVEETLACGVDFNVLPSGSLPAAGHQVHCFLRLPGGTVDVGFVGSPIQLVCNWLTVSGPCLILVVWCFWLLLRENWSLFHASGKALLVVLLSCTLLTSIGNFSGIRKDLSASFLESWGKWWCLVVTRLLLWHLKTFLKIKTKIQKRYDFWLR
jgi:hypothetical protein